MNKQDIIDSLKVIPPCSIITEGGDNPAHRLIASYFPLWRKVLEGKKVSWLERLWWLMTWWKKSVPKDWAYHMATYFGSGKNLVIETVPVNISWGLFSLPHGMVKCTDLKDKLNKDTNFRIYCNSKMTVEGLQNAKDFAYESIGSTYDLLAFVGFVMDPKINSQYNEDKSYICSEITVEIIRKSGVTFLGNFPSHRMHPQQAKEYLDSEKGQRDGWNLIFEWTGEKAIVYG